MSEEAKLFVAVANEDTALVIAGDGDWGHRIVGHDPGAWVEGCPEEPGMHVWEGAVSGTDEEPTWTGAWRPLQADEWDLLARGLPIWGDP
jgi:hypothetical protein